MNYLNKRMSYSKYDTPFNRILWVIDCYLARVESHINNLVLVVNEELHLVQEGKSLLVNSDLYFLYNLAADPYKASQIMRKMKSVLQKWKDVAVLGNENKDFYFELMYDAVTHNFKTDTAALFYVDRLILEISTLIEDDNRFSELTSS